ncbi:MAG: hypothetical protein AAGE52_19430 [Myxococcota bacterium]
MAKDDMLRGVTQRVVDLYTSGGFFFTALDVSNQVKQTLPEVRHRHVSPIVRELFDQGGMGASYTRTLIDVTTEGRKKAEAFLYHLEGGDIETGYGPDKRSQLAIPPVSAELDDETLDDNQTEVSIEIGADGRGRLPLTLLMRARILTTKVIAEMLGSDLVLSEHPPAPATPSPMATVLPIHHPTMLHIPATLLAPFDPAKVRAKVVGSQVYIQNAT